MVGVVRHLLELLQAALRIGFDVFIVFLLVHFNLLTLLFE